MQLSRIIIIISSIYLYCYLAIFSKDINQLEREIMGIVAIVIAAMGIILTYFEVRKSPPNMSYIVICPILAVSLFRLIRTEEYLVNQIVLCQLFFFSIYIVIVTFVSYLKSR